MIWQIIISYLLLINLVGFSVMGIDKWKAKNNKWRIPEKTLLLFSIIGGSLGSFLGMRVFHHKTKHAKFFIGIPLIFLVQVCLVIASQMYFKWM